MRSRISIRGYVRPSVRLSVGHTRVETMQKCRFRPKLLSVPARTRLMPCIWPQNACLAHRMALLEKLRFSINWKQPKTKWTTGCSLAKDFSFSKKKGKQMKKLKIAFLSDSQLGECSHDTHMTLSNHSTYGTHDSHCHRNGYEINRENPMNCLTTTCFDMSLTLTLHSDPSTKVFWDRSWIDHG